MQSDLTIWHTILIITNDLGKTSDLISKSNKHWGVAYTNDLYSKEVKQAISKPENKFILITTGKEIIKNDVLKFINYCKKYKIMPIVVNNPNNDRSNMLHLIYPNIENEFPESFEYICGENDNETRNDAENLLRNLLW